MHNWFTRTRTAALWLVGLCPILPGQLKVAAAAPVREIVLHTQAVLAEKAPANAHDLARFVFAHLRLGQIASARSLLQSFGGDERPDLVLIAHATFHATTGEVLLDRTQRQRLERALAEAEHQPASSFCAAALRVHSRYCLGELSHGDDRRDQQRLATSRLLALEAETWQPGRGHYRPTPCNGALKVPEAADASLLVPHSFGMLIATKGRLLRHLRNTLDASYSGLEHRWRATTSPRETAALRLLAAAQLGDDVATNRAYVQVVRQRSPSPSVAALNLEAILQAITGMRIAAGAGHGERWLRITPWLPESLDELNLRGVQIAQHRFGLRLSRDRQAAELRVELELLHPAQSDLTVVVGNRRRQYVTTVSAEHPLQCALPTGPEPDHDPLDRRRRLVR